MGMWEMSAFEIIAAGGPVMYPILLCSVFASGIFIEKMIYFASLHSDVHAFKQRTFELVKNNKIKEAIELCEKTPSPVAKIFRSGIARFGSTKEEIKAAMEEMSLFEIPKLEQRLSVLSTIANIAPLMGFLGTVTGLTGLFHTIQVRSAAMAPVTPGDLAGGIWEALLTTVAGLMVAVPTFVAYNYCVSRVNHFVREMEKGATELANFLCHLTEIDLTKHGH